MPYVKQVHRDWMDSDLTSLASWCNEDPGDCNYAITQLLLRAMKPSNYQGYNEVIGILECCKLEMYRRAVAPYEDTKKEANGDVFD